MRKCPPPIFAFALSLVACNGVGPGFTPGGGCNFASIEAQYQPNYYSTMQNPGTSNPPSLFPVWQNKAIKVFFEPLLNPSFPALVSDTMTGFNRWAQASGNAFTFQQDNNPLTAGVYVRFVSSAELPNYVGFTSFEGGKAVIRIAVQKVLNQDMMFFLTAHEMGHALGLSCHSPVATDVMYGGVPGVWPSPSASDVNMLRIAYCGALSPSSASPTSASTGRAPAYPYSGTATDLTSLCGGVDRSMAKK